MAVFRCLGIVQHLERMLKGHLNFMGKTTDKEKAGNSAGVANPELLFNGDALVVDYLNSLLASESALNMDSREIQMLHQAIRSGWKSTGVPKTVAGNEIIYETDFSKIETDALRNENENLKFKTELATIDAQVLRSENNNLKTEITYLTAQLNEMKDKLSTVQTQNNELRSSIEAVHTQLSRKEVDAESATLHMNTESVPLPEEVTEHVMVSELEHAVSLETVAAVTDQKETSQVDVTVQHDAITGEIPREILLSSPVADLDRSFITRVTDINNRESQKNNSTAVVFSRKNSAEQTFLPRPQSVSKVIKQSTAEKNHGTQQAGQVLKATAITTAQSGKNNNEATRRINVVQQHPVVEIQNKQEDPASNKGTLLIDAAEEIDVAPAPDPKIVVRRNVKNYEDLQKESDTRNTIIAGHTVVL